MGSSARVISVIDAESYGRIVEADDSKKFVEEKTQVIRHYRVFEKLQVGH